MDAEKGQKLDVILKDCVEGDKLECVSRGNWPWWTEGKTYVVHKSDSISSDDLCITDDDGDEDDYSAPCVLFIKATQEDPHDLVTWGGRFLAHTRESAIEWASAGFDEDFELLVPAGEWEESELFDGVSVDVVEDWLVERDIQQEEKPAAGPEELYADLGETWLDLKPSTESGGGSRDYYALPDHATELRHLISAKGMSKSRGDIFKACYRLGEKEGTSIEYDLDKLAFFVQDLKEMHQRGEHI